MNEKVKAKDLKEMSEEELREAEVVWPKTEEELGEIIDALIERNHTYGTCVYAMSIAMVSAMRYVSHELGVTGFQASCADLDVLSRTRNLNWGTLLDYEDLLWPQKWHSDNFPSRIDIWSDNKEKFAEKAKEKIEENNKGEVHERVWKHWEELANKTRPTVSKD